MRQLKFRAWEKYDPDYAREVEKTGEMHYTDAWPDEEVQDKRTVVIAGFYHDSGWDEKDFTVMQFTGLLDKNGKEIYEGDVLEFNRALMEEVGHKPVREVVEFVNGCFLPRPQEREDAEIIGNVWENPELL